MVVDNLAGYPIVTGRDMLLDHDRKLDELMAWRQELRGAWKLVTIAIGSSIVSAIASVIAIVASLSNNHP